MGLAGRIALLLFVGILLCAGAFAEYWPPPDACPIENGILGFAWEAWRAADINGNGAVSVEEAYALFPQLANAGRLFSLTRVNPLEDGYIFWEELRALEQNTYGLFDFLLPDNIFTLDENLHFWNVPELFADWDLNGDGIIDCRDVAIIALPEAPAPEYCPMPRDLPRVAAFVWPVFDTHGSGGLNATELERIDEDIVWGMTILDTSGDGEASLEEVLALLANPSIQGIYGLDFEQSIWEEGPGVVDYAYMDAYVPPNAFDWLDRDDSGLIDCVDLETPASGPAPNPEALAAALPLPDDVDPYTNYLWPYLLKPGERTLSYNDVDAYFVGGTNLSEIPRVDLNLDERISRGELELLLTRTGILPRTTLPYNWDGAGTITIQELRYPYVDVLAFIAADANGNGVLDAGDFDVLDIPSETEVANLVLDWLRGQPDSLGVMSLEEARDTLVAAGVPAFVVDAFDLDDSGQISVAEVRHAAPGSDLHGADTNGDGIFSIVELLRIVQFYNAGGLCCAASPGATEDGYQPGTGVNHQCLPHASDFEGDVADWYISLSELLRMIQLYHADGYLRCVEGASGDGFCARLK